MRRLIFILLVVTLAGCASPPRRLPEQKLYFALELRRDGRLVGKPKALGEAGKALRLQRQAPGGALADYELVLAPSEAAPGHIGLELEVLLPDARGRSKLELLHAEERKIELGPRPGDLEVTLLVMKVDSPEFKALMSLADFTPGAPGSI